MSNDKMFKTLTLNFRRVGRSLSVDQCFCHLNIYLFVIVLFFELRISFFCKKAGFLVVQ
jgi:hypothetical protein